MKKEEFNEKYKKFEKVYRGIYFLHLNELENIEKGNLEIIVKFNKPQDHIEEMNLISEYKKIPIKYKENKNRKIKIINFQKYKNKEHKKNISEQIRKFSKEW